MAWAVVTIPGFQEITQVVRILPPQLSRMRSSGAMQIPSVLATRATRKTTRFGQRDAKSIAAGATYSKHCSCSLIDLLQLHRWLVLCVRHGKNANMPGVPEASNASS
jgi:hypothetical protein